MATRPSANPQVRGVGASGPALSKAAPIRLRLDLFDRLAKGRGADNDAERARLIHIDQSVMRRVRAGDVAPGPQFIAGVLLAFPEWPFEELFVVEAGDLDEQVPA